MYISANNKRKYSYKYSNNEHFLHIAPENAVHFWNHHHLQIYKVITPIDTRIYNQITHTLASSSSHEFFVVNDNETHI